MEPDYKKMTLYELCRSSTLLHSLLQCDEFVDKYGNDIIKLLLEAVSPRLVCTALHLCLTATQEKVIVMPVVESGECVCEYDCVGVQVWGYIMCARLFVSLSECMCPVYKLTYRSIFSS